MDSGCKNIFVLVGETEVMLYVALCPEFLVGILPL